MKRNRKVVCKGFVELVTEYLEDAVEPDERVRIDQHLDDCPDCTRVLAQWRRTIALAGRLGEHEVEALSPATRGHLLAAFRDQPTAPD